MEKVWLLTWVVWWDPSEPYPVYGMEVESHAECIRLENAMLSKLPSHMSMLLSCDRKDAVTWMEVNMVDQREIYGRTD